MISFSSPLLKYSSYSDSWSCWKYSSLPLAAWGAEKRSAFLAVIGGVLGTIVLGSLFFIVGAILGLLIGSYLGAYWGEHQAGKAPDEARRAALAALMGSIAGKL